MPDTEFWAVKCRNCSSWVTNGLVETIFGTKLPDGTVQKECDACHKQAIYDFSEFIAVPVSFLLPKNPRSLST